MNDVNEQKVDEVVAKILKISVGTISKDLTPHRVQNWDSLNHLTLIASLEEEFAIEIEPEEIIEMYKGYDIVRSIVLKKLSAKV